ncbi:unnamed protein product [Eretmochelys imbricata]
MAGQLACSNDPQSLCRQGLFAPRRFNHAGLVCGGGARQNRHRCSPGWGSGIGLTTLSRKKTKYVTETATEKLTINVYDGFRESMTCMTASGESQKEATGMKTEVLNTKRKTKLGFWNIRTMYEAGKLAQVRAEMRCYSLHILGVSESRWMGSGRLTAASGETLLFSGRDDGQHHEGVAILLKKEVEYSLLAWKSISSRIMRARLKEKHNNITLIQCYAPTNDSDEDVKDKFYLTLQAELERVPRHDLTITMGDLNAKVGKNNTNNDRAMGRHGCGTVNENRERVVDFCNMNDLVIGGTLFEHCEIHKLTWCSPIGRDKNQIDHIMINGKWRHSLTDVKVRRGADVGSDHHLVTASIKLKLRSVGPPNKGHRCYDINKLKSLEILKASVLQLKNRFQALADLDEEEGNTDEEINKKWDKVTVIYKQSNEACLGYRQARRKE